MRGHRWDKQIAYGLILATALQVGVAAGWEAYPGLSGPGHMGMVAGDFDGDGRPEIAVSAYAGGYWQSTTQLLAILGTDPDGVIGVRTATVLPANLTAPLRLMPREGGADRLVAVMGEAGQSQIVVLGGLPLRILRTIEAPLVRSVATVADVDADGQLDIVALAGLNSWGATYPVVLDYETGAVKWTSGHEARDVAAAQLDDDAALELVLAGDNGTAGRIVDGATRADEWVYPAGFGDQVLVGGFGSGGSMGFATTSRWPGRVQVFRSRPYSPVLEIASGEVGAAAVMRRAGGDLIAVGNGQWGDVAVYDPRSGVRLVGFANPEHGVSAIAIADIDGDAREELVYGAGLTSSGPDLLRAVDLGTVTDDYSQLDEQGPYSALARGDLLGGGSDLVVYLTTTSQGYGGSTLHVLDAATGKRVRSRTDVLDYWSTPLPHVALAQLDADPQLEIVVAAGPNYPGIVAVLDGQSLEDQWRVSAYDGVLGNANLAALAMVDANGDGVQDVIVADANARLFVLNGLDGALLWQSVSLDGATPPSIAAFQTTAGAPRVVVGRGAGLYVFDLSTRLLVATTKIPDQVIAVWQWGSGAACRISALDQAAVLTMHACDTLALQGQRLLPAGSVFFRPLDAQGNRFIASSGAQLHEVAADGTASPMTGVLGQQLGANNAGDVRTLPDGQHFDVTIGSDYLVTRIRVGLDALFASGFE